MFYVDKGVLSGLRQFLVTESPLKIKRNVFYFTLKALFVLKFLNFCLDFLVMQKNDLIRKIKLISKFMTSQPGKHMTAIHKLLIVSRSKGNQTMKFGQLIKYNMRKIFLEKLFTSCGG